MFKYYCLNPIAQVGLEKFTEEFEQTKAVEEAQGILVRSAAMHDMELSDNLLAVARARDTTTFRLRDVRKRESWYSTRREQMPTE